MNPGPADDQILSYPGEWVATAQGQVIAHGRDFGEVAHEACRKARDISFEHIPDPAPILRLLFVPGTDARHHPSRLR